MTDALNDRFADFSTKMSRALAHVRIVCREGDHFGAVVERAGQGPAGRLELGELRLHLMEVVGMVMAGVEVVAGPLELPVLAYLSAAENGSLSHRLLELPTASVPAPPPQAQVLSPDPASAPMVLKARARYEVVGIRRSGGKRGPLEALEVVNRAAPTERGWVEIEQVILRLLQPPGALFSVACKGNVTPQEPALMPVVVRLTTHAENAQENDLIGLKGCKGKWGRLDEE